MNRIRLLFNRLYIYIYIYASSLKWRYGFVHSIYLFVSILFISFFFLSLTRFHPSLDGPAHLYSSFLLNQLVSGNEFLGEYLSINSFYIPNWISHFFLSIFLTVFDVWMAEKILIMLYVAGMAFYLMVNIF